jgi:hypothetical protein
MAPCCVWNLRELNVLALAGSAGAGLMTDEMTPAMNREERCLRLG